MRIPLSLTSLLALVSCALPILGQNATDPHLGHARTYAQCEAAFGDIPEPQSGSFIHYELVRMHPASIDSLRRFLRAHCWEHALRRFFGPARGAGFVDWVVYIGADGEVHQAITKGLDERAEFRGEKYVWVLVFSDLDLVPGDTGALRRDLSLSRRSVNYQRDPMLAALVKALSSKFFSAVEPPRAAALPDSSKFIELRQLSTDPGGNGMYVALDRWELSENAMVELGLGPSSQRELPGRLRSVYTNLGNASQSLWDVGITAGSSFGPRREVVEGTQVTGTRSGFRPNLYLTGYLNWPLRPRLPWRRVSLGPAFGFNLVQGAPFDELILGAAAGRVLGDAGVIVGISAVKVTELEELEGVRRQREERKITFFAGVDMRL
ncbi:MAG TPA: hypothetical protein VF746_24990 [Longimicrobium sp.]